MNINLFEEAKIVNKELSEIENEYSEYFSSFYSFKEKNFVSAEKKSDISFYYYYPFLFHNEFIDLPLESYRKVALSGVVYFRYLLWNDAIIDSAQIVTPSTLMYGNFLLRKSSILLYSLFPPASLFWNYFEKYNKEYTSALVLEKLKHVGIITEYSQSEFEIIAKGKSAMAKCATAALATLCNVPKKNDSLEIAQDYFHTAVQLYDDLQDWKQDYKNRQYSRLLTNVINEYQLVETVSSNHPPGIETISKAIYLSGAAETQMEDAILNLEKAVAHAPYCSYWIENIQQIKTKCQKAHDNASGIRKKLLLSREQQKREQEKASVTQEVIGAENSVSKNDSFIQRFLYQMNLARDYLLTQQNLNFPEMYHLMIFSNTSGFTGEQEHQWGNVFQSALLIDTLIDAVSLWPNIDEIVKIEIEKLISTKLKRVRGGWSYFPSLPELPPDADSLGQILQVLARGKYERIDEEVSDPVSLLLSQCSYEDGSFETWIVDKNDASQETAVIINAIENMWMWRKGKDNEVLANILYGLYLYDHSRFKERIEKGVDCLEKTQSQSGYWNSTWYWGNYYGTYTAIRIIKAIKPASLTLKKAETFLISSQNYDGGWGDIGSDPLNTALALLSLSLLESQNNECYINGIGYLFSTQNKKGYWDRVEFIKMYTGNSFRTYRSKTITTQYCLKALLALSKQSPLINMINQTFAQLAIYSKRQEPQVYAIYKDFKRFVELAEEKGNEEKRKLLNENYINPNKNFFEELFKFSSLSQKSVAECLIAYNKEEYKRLIELLEEDDLKQLCKADIDRCIEVLPFREKPSVYLWIGNSNFSGAWMIIDDKPAIIISLEMWSDIQYSKTPYQAYFKNRICEIKTGIPLIIANQFCRLILNHAGFPDKTIFNKLFIDGLSTYFSNIVFAEFPLSFHLFFTSAELEWCQKNEKFLKREIEPYLYCEDHGIIKNYFDYIPDNKNIWFPSRVGSYVGYRMVEEYMKQEINLSIRDLIRESSIVINKSTYF